MEPQNIVGVAQLASLAMQGVDLHPLRSYLMQNCIEGEQRAGALMDLAIIDQLYGDREQGLVWQAKAFETCTLFRTDRGKKGKKTLLVFALPTDIGGNTPIEFLLRSDEFEIMTLYLRPGASAQGAIELPEHDVAFCAAPADAAEAEAFHALVQDLTRRTGKTVFNAHGAPTKLGRVALKPSLPKMDGLRLAETTELDRAALVQALTCGAAEPLFAGCETFPCVIRPVGSHAGHGLEKLSSASDLASYLRRHDNPAFYLSEYIDYASEHDGRFRKYRIMFIDGKAYPCHLAIAEQWDVWYMNANMQLSEAKCHEEAAFLEGFEMGFGKRHEGAFNALIENFGLDYFGIDCSEDKDGRLVVFEADNSLIVHDMDSDPSLRYKAKHTSQIFSAFEEMLSRACAAS